MKFRPEPILCLALLLAGCGPGSGGSGVPSSGSSDPPSTAAPAPVPPPAPACNAPAGVGIEASIVAGLLKADLRAALRSIRANHGRPISQIIKSDVRWGTEAVEAAYVAIVHSDLEGTIRDTFGSSFTPVADYGSGAKVMQGEFGNFENIRFISTALLGKRVGTTGFPTVAAAPTLLSDNGTHANLYDVIVFAADAWIGVALKGEHAVHPTMVSAKPSDSDPLGQRRKCGYKTMQNAKVTQVAHVKRIVCGALKAA